MTIVARLAIDDLSYNNGPIYDIVDSLNIKALKQRSDVVVWPRPSSSRYTISNFIEEVPNLIELDRLLRDHTSARFKEKIANVF